MHSSGVCAHPRGSGCASASYLESQETPCQSRDSPFLWERFGQGGNPAAWPRAERQQHCLQQCWMDSWPDRQMAPDLGRLLGHRVCGGQHGQGRGSQGRVRAGPASTGLCHSGASLRSSTLGMPVVGRRDPALWMHPVGMLPPALLPSQGYPHAPSACPACCDPIATAAGPTCQLSQTQRPPPGKAAASSQAAALSLVTAVAPLGSGSHPAALTPTSGELQGAGSSRLQDLTRLFSPSTGQLSRVPGDLHWPQLPCIPPPPPEGSCSHQGVSSCCFPGQRWHRRDSRQCPGSVSLAWF